MNAKGEAAEVEARRGDKEDIQICSPLAAHSRVIIPDHDTNDSVVRFGSTSRGVRTSRAVALASSDGERASGAR